ncbi:retrovirus-related pol polyprotein from transposon TNT 1-94 [Tanacetum coccineum]
MGTVRFGNDQVAAIMVYGDYQIRNVTISRVYYVEELGHNLFSVGQFHDADLEVAFRKYLCFICNLEGIDLLKGSWGTNLYTILLEDMLHCSPICLLYKASKTKSWLWQRHLSHLNFGAINQLAKESLVEGLPKLKYEKGHFPMRVESIHGKKYILVIVDDFSRFTWVKFLRSKDETPEFVIKFLKKVQATLNATYFNPTPCIVSPMLPVAVPLPVDTTGTPSSTTIDQDAPSVSTLPTTQEIQALVIHQVVEEQIQGS